MKPIGYNNLSKNQFSSAFVKFAVCFLLLGLAYRVFTSTSFVRFAPVDVVTPPVDTSSSAFVEEEEWPSSPVTEPPVPSDHSLVMQAENPTPQKVGGKCDIFAGEWVPDPAGPSYTNNSCSTIEHHQNCMTNGRPDSGYMYWRWKPKDCDLSKFDAIKFLNFMRNKWLAFIGDSIMRNHVQSLLCTLSQMADATEVDHDEHYHNRRWHFPSYNFSLSVVWSPFLTKSMILEDDDGVSTGILKVHIDELDPVWVEQYESFDYIFIAGGKWYLKAAIYYENNTIIGCHNCNMNNITEIGFEDAYRKAINSVLSFIAHSNHTVYTLLRTTTPDHFENGSWDSGGYCNRTVPFKEGEVDVAVVDQEMHQIELEEFEKASNIASEQGQSMRLFDTTYLSLLRPDGHPGVYRQFHPYDGKDKDAKIQNDCLHWCLPGPIDSWNDLLWQLLQSG